MDLLLSRHRKELRDLQSVVTQKKKQASKRNRKQVNSECDHLGAEVRSRHAREVKALEDPISLEVNDENCYIPPPNLESPDPDLAAPSSTLLPDGHDNPHLHDSGVGGTSQKPQSRQKARLARRAVEIAALTAAAEQEASEQPSLRDQELSKMAELIKDYKLSEHLIAPDGHCLYSAFAHSLNLPGGCREARKACGAFMNSHPDDFAAFLEEPLETHVQKIMETAEWGGQAEVLALGRAFGVSVKVLQAEGRGVEVMNEGDGEKGEVWLSYYRHSFGLGEHYNALVKKLET